MLFALLSSPAKQITRKLLHHMPFSLRRVIKIFRTSPQRSLATKTIKGRQIPMPGHFVSLHACNTLINQADFGRSLLISSLPFSVHTYYNVRYGLGVGDGKKICIKEGDRSRLGVYKFICAMVGSEAFRPKNTSSIYTFRISGPLAKFGGIEYGGTSLSRIAAAR